MQEFRAIATRRRVAGAFLGCLLGAAVLPTFAQERISGVLSQGCAVHWEAKSTLLDGGALTGFTQTVRPADEPGWMEVQHWNWTATSPMAWRYVVATDHAIQDATLTVHLPPAGGPWVASTEDLVKWVTDRAHIFYPTKTYAWHMPSPPTQNADGSLTFQLGDLPAQSGVIFAYSAPLHPDMGRGPYEGTATLRGTYAFGNPATCQPAPPAPVPMNAPWALLALAGLTALTAGWRSRRKG